MSKIATKSRQTKQRSRPTQPPPDEDYFRKVQRREVDRPGFVREEVVQQSLELPELSSSPSASAVPSHDDSFQATATGEQTDSSFESVEVALKAIEAEIVRLGWVPVQASVWIAQHFSGKTQSELSLGELVLLLQQLQQLHRSL